MTDGIFGVASYNRSPMSPTYGRAAPPSEDRIEALRRFYAGRCSRCGAKSCRRHRRAKTVERRSLTAKIIRGRFDDLVERGLSVAKVSKAMRQLDPGGGWTHEKVRAELAEEERCAEHV